MALLKAIASFSRVTPSSRGTAGRFAGTGLLPAAAARRADSRSILVGFFKAISLSVWPLSATACDSSSRAIPYRSGALERLKITRDLKNTKAPKGL